MPTTALTVAEISAALASLPGWSQEENTLTKTYRLPSYAAGLMFASAIGTLAEALNHHPDLYIGYKTVRVSLTTHDAGNAISAHDVSLAQAIEALAYPKP